MIGRVFDDTDPLSGSQKNLAIRIAGFSCTSPAVTSSNYSSMYAFAFSSIYHETFLSC